MDIQDYSEELLSNAKEFKLYASECSARKLQRLGNGA